MKRDWIWAWITAVPAVVVATIALVRSGLWADQVYPALGLAFALAAAVSTAVLWLKNRHSIRKLTRAGREIELVVRPLDGIVKAAFVFPTIFGVLVLMSLVLRDGREWGEMILLSALLAYMLGLNLTAYRKDG